MWQETVKAIATVILETFRELPEPVRTPAAVAWCMAGLLVVVLASLVAVALFLPEAHWATVCLIGALAIVGLMLLAALAICIVIIIAGVVARFLGRR